MRRNLSLWSLVVVVFALMCAQTAFADLYLSSGQYRFTVRVENKHFKDIRNARGSVSVSGNYARLDVEAPGYRRAYETVYLSPNQTTYYPRVRLEDPFVNVHLVDQTHSFIPSASADFYSQSLYWGDEFGLRGRLPKEGFAQLTARDIDVNVNSMFAFAPRVYLSDSGDYWRFEIIVRRDDMNSYSNNIRVIFPRDPDAPRTHVVRTIALGDLTADYQANLALKSIVAKEDLEVVLDRLDSLTRSISDEFSRLDAGQQQSVLQTLPSESSLSRDLKARRSFTTLHQ